MHRLIAYRPPRIAMTLLMSAVAANAFLPLQWHPALPAAATITGLVGFALMIRAWWLFKLKHTAICPTDASSYLVTNDVFSVTRNPMYLGMFMMLMGLALANGNVAFYVAALTYGIVIDRVFCAYEEAKSLAEFGDEYRAYISRVRRWL